MCICFTVLGQICLLAMLLKCVNDIDHLVLYEKVNFVSLEQNLSEIIIKKKRGGQSLVGLLWVSNFLLNYSISIIFSLAPF